MSNEHPDLPILHPSSRRRFGVRGSDRRPPERKTPAAAHAPDYDAAFERVLPRVRTLDRILGRERREAPALLAALEPHPQPRRLLMIGNSERYHSAGLCDLLLKEAWEARFDDPGRTLAFAELAVAVSDRLMAEGYGLGLVEDLRVRAWSHLGNARRIRSDLRGAEEAFEEAERRIARGHVSTSRVARLLDFRASLEIVRNRFDRAEAFLDRAMALYRSERQFHEYGRSLLNKAAVRGYVDDVEGEITLLRRALQLVDSIREPRAVTVAVFNLIDCLHQSGRNEEALTWLIRWRSHSEETADQGVLVRLRWLEGSITRELGRLHQAEKFLKEAQRGLAAQDLSYDTALVSLELAEVYLRQHRSAEVRDLVRDMLPIFRSRELHREAAAALIVFCQAAKQERLTLSLVTEVAEFLKRSREDPTLRFGGRAGYLSVR